MFAIHIFVMMDEKRQTFLKCLCNKVTLIKYPDLISWISYEEKEGASVV